MLEQGGPRNDEEKQFVKQYAVFFRIPRLRGNTPAFLQSDRGQSDKPASTVGDEMVQGGNPEIQQQRLQALPPCSSIGMSNQPDTPQYEASMFDPQNFPQLPANAYDPINEVDLGFSDFFGGLQDTDLAWLK